MNSGIMGWPGPLNDPRLLKPFSDNQKIIITSNEIYIPARPLIWLTLVASGAGGGYADLNGRAGGGAAGAAINRMPLWVIVGVAIEVIVGLGVPGSTDGNDSSFGGIIIAKGGKKGGDGISGLGGAGTVQGSWIYTPKGILVPCPYNVSTQQDGAAASSVPAQSGAGGLSQFGIIDGTTAPGGTPVSGYAAGIGGAQYGAGGSGASTNAAAIAPGGSGARGICIIEEG